MIFPAVGSIKFNLIHKLNQYIFLCTCKHIKLSCKYRISNNISIYFIWTKKGSQWFRLNMTLFAKRKYFNALWMGLRQKKELFWLFNFLRPEAITLLINQSIYLLYFTMFSTIAFQCGWGLSLSSRPLQNYSFVFHQFWCGFASVQIILLFCDPLLIVFNCCTWQLIWVISTEMLCLVFAKNIAIKKCALVSCIPLDIVPDILSFAQMQFCKHQSCFHVLFKQRRLSPGSVSKQTPLARSSSNCAAIDFNI